MSAPRLKWAPYQGKGFGVRAELAGVGDYYVTPQRLRAKGQPDGEPASGKLLGYTIQLNTHKPNAKGWHWTDLGSVSVDTATSATKAFAAAKARAAADVATRSVSNPSKVKPRAKARTKAKARKRVVTGAAPKAPRGVARWRVRPNRGAELEVLGTREQARKVAQALADKSGHKVTVQPVASQVRGRRTRGGKRSNPGNAEMEAARRTFEMWHEYEPTRVTEVHGPTTVPKTLVLLGELREINYVSSKWGGKPVHYTHRCKKPYPLLTTDPKGQHLFIVGGGVKVTPDGLVD